MEFPFTTMGRRAPPPSADRIPHLLSSLQTLIPAMAPAAAAKSDDEDNYEEYIPVSKRRAMEAERLRLQRLSKPAAPSSAGFPASLPPPPLPPMNHPAAAPDVVMNFATIFVFASDVVMNS